MSKAVDQARSEARQTDPDYQARIERTEGARRSWRFKAAQERIRKIVDGWPPLTDEQRTQLALLLQPGGDNAAS